MNVPFPDIVLGVCLGIGLASACGFRVFVPPLLLGVAQRAEFVPMGTGPEWLGSWAGLAALGVASALELGAYYIPWVDNVLDTIASPLAVLAGILLSASVMHDLGPTAQWSLAIIAGGGAAATTQAVTVVLRGLSSATTGGFANFLVATGEFFGSIAVTVLTILFAPLAVVMMALVVYALVRALRRRAAAGRARSATPG